MFLNNILLRTIFLFFVITTLFSVTLAQTTGEPIITIDNLINAITPLVIFGATWIVQKIKPTLVGWNIVWIVVPILSLVASSLLVLIDQATSFWSQFLWNFLSVAVAQFVLQLTENKRLQNANDKKLILKKNS